MTARGGIRLEARPNLRPIAFETITTQAWSQRVAFCLPEAESAMNRRAVLTELGPDAQALRAQDRDAVRFDLGLDVVQVDCCIRTTDVELIAGLRAQAGRSLFEPGNPAMGLILRHSPHRVFVTRAGRAEVYQGIPAPGGTAPEGPAHPCAAEAARAQAHACGDRADPARLRLLRAPLSGASAARRLTAARGAFDAARYAAFQRLLSRYGDVEHVRLKRNVAKALNAGAGPEAIAMPDERFAQAAIRVALRQLKASEGPSPASPPGSRRTTFAASLRSWTKASRDVGHRRTTSLWQCTAAEPGETPLKAAARGTRY